MAKSSLLLFFLLAFVGFNRLVKEARGAGKRWWIGIITVLIAAGGYVILNFSFPKLLTESTLFQPELFASHLFPSLGSLLVISLMAIALVSLYYLHGKLPGNGSQRVSVVLSLLLFLRGICIAPIDRKPNWYFSPGFQYLI